MPKEWTLLSVPPTSESAQLRENEGESTLGGVIRMRLRRSLAVAPCARPLKSATASPPLLKDEERKKSIMACVKSDNVGFLPSLRSRNSPLARAMNRYERVPFLTTTRSHTMINESSLT